MNKIIKFFTYLIHHPERIALHFWDSIAPIIPDRLFLIVKYRLMMGYWMTFDNPKTYTEKLQWLKLYDRQPLYTQMVDKYAVKEYVAKLIGEQYIIPTLGIWDKPEQIEWDTLPEQFVLKTTHGGGNCGVVIVHDKENINRDNIVMKLHSALKQDLFITSREWPYKGVPKRIIAEKYIANNPIDYKFYCFGGEPKLLLVASNRSTLHNYDYFDMDFQHLDIISICGNNALTPIKKPVNYDKMIELVRTLSKDIPHVRIDLYNENGHIYFGEITFYDTSGYDDMNSAKWNKQLGDWIDLTCIKS